MNTSENFSGTTNRKKPISPLSAPIYKILAKISLSGPVVTLSAQIELPYKSNKTLPYDQVIDLYRQLDQEFEEDINSPLHTMLRTSCQAVRLISSSVIWERIF